MHGHGKETLKHEQMCEASVQQGKNPKPPKTLNPNPKP